jgi:hypothetical protein
VLLAAGSNYQYQQTLKPATFQVVVDIQVPATDSKLAREALLRILKAKNKGSEHRWSFKLTMKLAPLNLKPVAKRDGYVACDTGRSRPKY